MSMTDRHVCALCDPDHGDGGAVSLERPNGRCSYYISDYQTCRETARYLVRLVYCPLDHCRNDPEHRACGPEEDGIDIEVCNDHALLMRSDPYWQVFRSIHSLPLERTA